MHQFNVRAILDLVFLTDIEMISCLRFTSLTDAICQVEFSGGGFARARVCHYSFLHRILPIIYCYQAMLPFGQVKIGSEPYFLLFRHCLVKMLQNILSAK